MKLKSTEHFSRLATGNWSTISAIGKAQLQDIRAFLKPFENFTKLVSGNLPHIGLITLIRHEIYNRSASRTNEIRQWWKSWKGLLLLSVTTSCRQQRCCCNNDVDDRETRQQHGTSDRSWLPVGYHGSTWRLVQQKCKAPLSWENFRVQRIESKSGSWRRNSEVLNLQTYWYWDWRRAVVLAEPQIGLSHTNESGLLLPVSIGF